MRLGRPVSGSWVARKASSSSRRVELLVGALALDLKALAHPQQAELEAQLQDVQGLAERLGAGVELARRSRAAPRPSRCATRSSAGSPRPATPRAGRRARRRSATFPGRPRCATSMPSPAIQRATAIVELRLIRSKLPCTTASTSWPDPAVCSTVRRSTSSARAFSASPRRHRSSPGGSTGTDGGAGTRISSRPDVERRTAIVSPQIGILRAFHEFARQPGCRPSLPELPDVALAAHGHLTEALPHRGTSGVRRRRASRRRRQGRA